MGALLNWFLDDSYAEWMIINMYLFWIWSTKHFNMYCALVMGKIPWPSKNLYTMCLRIQRSYFVQSHLIADVIHSWILVDYCSSFLFLFCFLFFLCFLSYSHRTLKLHTWICEIKQQIPEGPWPHLQYVNWLAGWLKLYGIYHSK